MDGRTNIRQGDASELVSRLWRLECRRLLSRLSREEYRQSLATLLPAPGGRHGDQETQSPESAWLATSARIPGDDDGLSLTCQQPHTA